jgi:16S rRNA (guanine527-N7)-methyltransferase
VFTSGRLALAQRYAAWLADDGVVRGLIGPREAPRLWERHLLNCAVLGEAVPADARVADLGSGAGLPGLVLAIARPDVHVTLVEPLLRRTTFLEEVCADLAPHGLDNVRVVRGRAEALHGEQTFDVVTARALAPLERLLGWGMPLVAPHGALVAMKGSSAGEEIEAAAPALHRLRCAPPEVIELGAELLEQPTRVVRVVWAEPPEVGWRSDRSADLPAGRSTSKSRKKRRR